MGSGKGAPQCPYSRTSASNAAPWTRTTAGYLALVPPLDLGAEPEPRTTRTEIEDRPWHVRPPALVLADGVSMGEAQDPGDIVGVDELIK
jgi:hypothetical protein